MREVLSLRADMIDEVERRAVLSGCSADEEAGRLMARGLLDLLAELLRPLLQDDDPKPKPGVVCESVATTSSLPVIVPQRSIARNDHRGDT